MKTRCLLLCVLQGSCFGAVSDPVVDYLQASQTKVWGRADRQFYIGDAIFTLDVDLNNDGTDEFLVSSSLDRDGKQGNVFYLYRRDQGGFAHVDELHLDIGGFYLGPIEEAGAYGVVKFWPFGGGQGGITAHIFDGSALRQIELGEVARDPVTLELKRPSIWEKYFGEKAIRVTDKLKTLTSQDLARKYGLKVQQRSYAESIEAPTSPPSVPPKFELVSKLDAPPLLQRTAPKNAPEKKTTLQPPSEEPTSSTQWSIIVVLIVAAGGLLWLLLKRRP